jgi:hypothetical protein
MLIFCKILQKGTRMEQLEQVTPLKSWMDAKGYSNSELARLMDFSYEYIFKFSTGKLPILSEAFKWRFVERFGWEEAAKVFDVPQRQKELV